MKYFVAFFFLGFFTITDVQTGHAQQMMLGVRGGVNLASQQWDGISPNVSLNAGELAGVEMDYWFNPELAASIQVLFDQKGAQAIGVADGPPGYAVSWTGNYIEVPLFLKLNTIKGSFRPYLFGGPSIGFLMSNKESGNFRGSYPGDFMNGAVDITDSTKKMDLSLVLGFGISNTFPSGQQILADAGFAVGLINTDNYSSDKANGISVYSLDIRLAAGVLFPLN